MSSWSAHQKFKNLQLVRPRLLPTAADNILSPSSREGSGTGFPLSQGICVRNSPNAGDSVHGHQSSNTFVSGLAIDASFIIHNSIVRRLYCFSITQSSASAGLRFGALWCALWFPPSHETPFYFICSLSSGINPTFIWYPCVQYCWLLSRSPVFVIMCKKKDIIWSRFSSESCANQPFLLLLLSFFFFFLGVVVVVGSSVLLMFAALLEWPAEGEGGMHYEIITDKKEKEEKATTLLRRSHWPVIFSWEFWRTMSVHHCSWSEQSNYYYYYY